MRKMRGGTLTGAKWERTRRQEGKGEEWEPGADDRPGGMGAGRLLRRKTSRLLRDRQEVRQGVA